MDFLCVLGIQRSRINSSPNYFHSWFIFNFGYIISDRRFIYWSFPSAAQCHSREMNCCYRLSIYLSAPWIFIYFHYYSSIFIIHIQFQPLIIIVVLDSEAIVSSLIHIIPLSIDHRWAQSVYHKYIKIPTPIAFNVRFFHSSITIIIIHFHNHFHFRELIYSSLNSYNGSR